MKNVLLLCLLSLAFAGCHSTRQPQSPPLPAQNAPNSTSKLIIYYDATVGKAKLLKAAQKYQAKVIYQYTQLNGIAIAIPPSSTQEEAIRFFSAVPGVLSVQPSRVNKLH